MRKQGVTRLFSVLLVLGALLPALPAHAEVHWDVPRSLAASTDAEQLSGLRVVRWRGRFYLFMLARGEKRAVIRYFSTGDLDAFRGPRTAVEDIPVEPGFFPRYDVLAADRGLYLAWNGPDGALRLARSTDGSSWERRRDPLRPGELSFDPRLMGVDDRLLLFYHTESEGRRIDFFYTVLGDFGGAWAEPRQVARATAGSFFPDLLVGDRLWVAWQSRPLSEGEEPVFDIYLSSAGDPAGPWSAPVNLTGPARGDDMRPVLLRAGAGIALVWESNREGAWGVYYREFDARGNPLGAAVKVNGVPANARNPGPLEAGGKLYIFYTDERDGTPRLYYALKEEAGFRELGPVPGGAPVRELQPLAAGGELHAAWRSDEGVGVSGPDRSVRQVEILHAGEGYIGVRGLTLAWRKPEDPSGIAGYGYLFNRNPDDRPLLLNLEPEVTSVHLAPEQEGEHYVHLMVRDGAGNESDPVTVPFVVDLTPPPAPVVDQIQADQEGYHPGEPRLTWSPGSDDVAGYTYRLARSPVELSEPVIKTRTPSASFSGVAGGAWYFNVAAVDRAGNLSPTSTMPLMLRPPPAPEEGGPPVSSPPWVLLPHRVSVNPFLNLALYVVLFGLLAVVFLSTAHVLARHTAEHKGTLMKKAGTSRSAGGAAPDGAFQPAGRSAEAGTAASAGTSPAARGKKYGLRFKYSLLTVGLVLILTIGISLVLSIVALENEKRALARQMIDKAGLSRENLANVAREGILNNDDLLLGSVIRKTMENQDIRFSAILDRGGTVIAHSDLEQQDTVPADDFTLLAVRAGEPLISPEFDPESLAPLYRLSAPVFFSEQRLGTVILGYSTDSIFETIEETRRRSILNTLAITAVTILVGIVGAVLMASITIKPIKVLARGVNIIGGGNLDYQIEVRARDEIGMLADEFNRMTSRLKKYQEQVAEKAKLDEQLDIARSIQQDLIPRSGVKTDRLSVMGYYQAAAGVGGDYYDFINVGNGNYGFIMSDVAGKGVPASLMMIMIRTMFKALVNTGVREPSRLASLINRTLSSDISSDRFATLLFGVLDVKTRQFRYTNAGYGPLIVYRKKTRACTLVNPVKGSFPIGVLPDVQYEEESPLRLRKGDVVLLCTDGIHEARNSSDQEYGMERLLDLVPRVADQDAEGIAAGIVNDVLGFAGEREQYDDMTLLALKLR